MRKIAHAFLFVIQFCFYWILFPVAKLIYGNKRVWIICERGDDARDNGYWMFKYLSTEHSYVNQYYLINKHSVDFQKVNNLGKVVRYKSLKHWLLYIAAEARLTTHLSAFAPGNYIGEWFKHHKQSGVNVFLQHGITHNEFPSNHWEHNGSDLFICGAKPEYDHISKECGYPEGNVVFTGFARFDNLHDYEVKKQILIMPSWRSYLYGLKEKDFVNSEYFKKWVSVLSNSQLVEYCRANGYKIVFYPHYSMQNYVNCFNGFDKSVVSIADFDHFDVQTLLKESALLVTDYSSILFDFAYMRKPQFLYQFDENDFYGKHYQRSYFNHRENGFGEVVVNENDLVSSIMKSCENNNKLDDKFSSRIDDFFPLYDDLNAERIYQAIVKKYISKKKHHMFADELNCVVTGDDYGRNAESSEGIRQAFSKGYIQHASVMVNKDERFTMDLVNIDKSKFGLHLNLTEGYASFGDTDVYAYSVNEPNSFARKVVINRKSYFSLSKDDADVIKNEITGQVEQYKKLGFNCDSFDSHGHVHIKKPIAKVIIPIMRENDFKNCRIPQNVSIRHKLFHVFYTLPVTRLYRKNFNTTRYFCTCNDFIHIKHYRKFKNKTIEIMTHPFMDKYSNLTNRRDIDFDLLYKGANNERK